MDIKKYLTNYWESAKKLTDYWEMGAPIQNLKAGSLVALKIPADGF